MSNFSKGKPPEITYISPMIRERKQKACRCQNRRLVIDLTNRTVECSVCGQFIDPFDALCEVSELNDSYNYYLEGRYEYAKELDKWFNNHKEPITLKRIIEEYRSGMIPYCPNCNKPFDLPDIKMWTSRQFYEKLKERG